MPRKRRKMGSRIKFGWKSINLISLKQKIIIWSLGCFWEGGRGVGEGVGGTSLNKKKKLMKERAISTIY